MVLNVLPAVIVPSPALITPRADNAFPNILEANVFNNIGRNSPFCSFPSSLIVPIHLLVILILQIFIISTISSFEIINVVVPDFIYLFIYFWIVASVNPNEIKALLANDASTSFINGKPAVINSLRTLTNPPYWLVLFLLVPFKTIPLFSKDFISFIICFTSLFVRVIPEPNFF